MEKTNETGNTDFQVNEKADYMGRAVTVVDPNWNNKGTVQIKYSDGKTEVVQRFSLTRRVPKGATGADSGEAK